MTVYRRPDPIPLRRAAATSRAPALAAVRTEPDNLNRIVERAIFHAVAGGRFPVGSILPNEHQLAADLGVSRTALREAIKGLASKGMVETRRKRGTLVLEREHWNMLDPDLISWSRREGGSRTSRDLWQAVSVVQQAVAAALAEGGQAPIVQEAVQRFEAAGAGRGRDSLCRLLLDIAAHGNPYLRATNAACLRNLLADDPSFLDAQLGRITPAGLDGLVDAIRSRQPAAARQAAQALLGAIDMPALLPATAE